MTDEHKKLPDNDQAFAEKISEDVLTSDFSDESKAKARANEARKNVDHTHP